jgi:hypothetical protein
VLHVRRPFTTVFSLKPYHLLCCFSFYSVSIHRCGKVIGNKWDTYLGLLQSDHSEGYVMLSAPYAFAEHLSFWLSF